MQFLVKLHGFLHKLHVHAIFLVMQFYHVGCRSTRLDLRNVVLSNEFKQKILKRCTLRKWLVTGLLVIFFRKIGVNTKRVATPQKCMKTHQSCFGAFLNVLIFSLVCLLCINNY